MTLGVMGWHYLGCSVCCFWLGKFLESLPSVQVVLGLYAGLVICISEVSSSYYTKKASNMQLVSKEIQTEFYVWNAM